MAHLIDMSKGNAAMAYTGEQPWHGLGTTMTAGQTLDQWREAAGLDWTAKEAVVEYKAITSHESVVDLPFTDRKVLYRSDTLKPLSVVGADYRPVQPAQIINFYDELCDKHGYAMETMGALKDGKMVWALAKTGVGAKIAGIDEVQAYLLLYTSFDGSCATTGKFTDVRVVCNNTLSMAQGTKGGKSISVRHDSLFNANSVKAELGVGEVWEKHLATLSALSEVQVTPQQQVNFLLDVYHGMTAQSIGADTMKVKRTMERLAGILTQAPGATMPTAYGTLYGLLNAVTYDVDHSLRAHSDDTRLASAWLGAGDALKTKALEAAVSLAHSA